MFCAELPIWGWRMPCWRWLVCFPNGKSTTSLGNWSSPDQQIQECPHFSFTSTHQWLQMPKLELLYHFWSHMSGLYSPKFSSYIDLKKVARTSKHQYLKWPLNHWVSKISSRYGWCCDVQYHSKSQERDIYQPTPGNWINLQWNPKMDLILTVHPSNPRCCFWGSLETNQARALLKNDLNEQATNVFLI
jgi:hypothetical protein